LNASIDSVKEDPPLESRGGTSFTQSIDAFKGWTLLLLYKIWLTFLSLYPIVKWGVLPSGQFLWFPRYIMDLHLLSWKVKIKKASRLTKMFPTFFL
jgi:hypothetical protein